VLSMDPMVQVIGGMLVFVVTTGSAFFFIGRLSARVAALETDSQNILLELKQLRMELHAALVAGGHVQCPVLGNPARYGLRKASGESEL
jgi:hypothetical protein